MTARLEYGRLSNVGKAVVRHNESVFTEMFVEGLSQRMTKRQMEKLMQSVITDSLDIYDDGARNATDVYAELARIGKIRYLVSPDGLAHDASWLVESNYDKFGVSAGTIPRKRPPTPAEKAKRPQASASRKPAKTTNRTRRTKGARR